MEALASVINWSPAFAVTSKAYLTRPFFPGVSRPGKAQRSSMQVLMQNIIAGHQCQWFSSSRPCLVLCFGEPDGGRCFAHGLLRVWAGLKFYLLLLLAGVLLLHLHHGAAGPRQVGGISAQQLPAHPEPGQPPNLQVSGEGRLVARPDGWQRWAVWHRDFER